MIQHVKKSKFKKVVAIYLALMILLETFQPLQLYALTGGPSQPEFESFTPIGTSDMVDLASGDLNYNIPIMDVGGYPLNLAYTTGATMDQEASWVGLGWDLNVGQISRQLRGLPDDFNGDEMTYENNMKPNVTIGSSVNGFISPFGLKEAPLSVGMGIKYNNYDGLGVAANGGLSYQIANNVSVGMNLESSASEGVSASPSITFSDKSKDASSKDNSMSLNAGVSYNSRKGVESMTISASRAHKDDKIKTTSGSLSFIDASYTPTKRVGMVSSNFMFSLNVEVAFWGLDPGVKFAGYYTSQGIKDSEKYKLEKAYGFENTYNAGKAAVLDFNREKDRTFNKNTTSLPITNNTYDLYSIQGQGVSGVYRPYKSQVGYVYDNETTDDTSGGSLGSEFGTAGGFHLGLDATVTKAQSSTSLWVDLNPALGRFVESKKANNKPDYEKVFFKNIGGMHTDRDLDLFNVKLGGYDPVKLGISGGGFSRSTKSNYNKNGVDLNSSGAFKRESGRLSRNQSIEKLTKAEAKRYGFKTQLSAYAKDDHTAEIRITKEGGERNMYGRAAYNSIKKEATFDVGSTPTVNSQKGLVQYAPENDNSVKNSQEGDQYFNRITTPAYAHSYLLTSVLSADYQDLTADGPTDDDLGTYTKFEYDNKSVDKQHLYKWRVPFMENQANYDEGLRSSKKDNKGNYQYGEKELLYIKKIVTKTHIAIFHLSERNDGYGVKGENGGIGTDSKMYKLDKISLYSKPEYLANGEQAIPIKEAHFEYNYSLCQGIDNNINKNKPEFTGQQGKLTLSKVYFTYKNSNMGKFTPYVFTYGFNPSYDMKAYDVWGNYNPQSEGLSLATTAALSNAEFPFVDQKDKAKADQYTSAWLLQTIHLPSGGEMELNYESDDYGKVQNKEVMQMFKVVGSGNVNQLTAANIDLVNKIKKQNLGNSIYIELDRKIDNTIAITDSRIRKLFYDKYLKSIVEADKPIYFRFLLNMVDPNPLPGIDGTDKYDYVTGYLNVAKGQNGNDCGFLELNGKQYVAIPVNYVGKGDGFNSGKDVNPITKAGWNFGRHNLNRLVYSMHNEEDTNNLKGVVMELIGWMPTLLDIFKSPNAKLQEKGIASKFITGKSWIRLMQPEGRKLGGGSRVKDIKIRDQWNVMTGHPNDADYKQYYGQKYSYESKEGKSSGVATYEPLGCKENPFVLPFYDKTKSDLLLGPENDNYVEEPFGESFFPSPKITYSRVTVANLPRENNESVSNPLVVKKHATGSVVTEFYTSSEYPTLVNRTTLTSKYDKSNALASILNIRVRDHITMSQGYTVHTNDMDGKMKNQRVYGEGKSGDDIISGVDYNYNKIAINQNVNQGVLNNTVKTIDSKGNIYDKLVGVDYDVINDFRESKSVSTTAGIHFNTEGLPFAFILVVVPIPLPSISIHESQIRTAVTTKIIHTSGILSEKVAYDLGAKVATKNLAWDADTGEVLLTQTVNEYNDNYFNLNYPAYWNYDGMSQAAKNIGLEWNVTKTGNNQYQLVGNNKPSDYLIDGDEVWLSGLMADNKTKNATKAWVVKAGISSFQLINQDGILVKDDFISTGKIKVIRSGHRNLQMASMAGITAMRNPLYNYDSQNKITTAKTQLSAPSAADRIVNASAVAYNAVWPSQCECNLPKMVFVDGVLKFGYETEVNNPDQDDILKRSYNPYLYNILGNWRANKSYAYLTGRDFTVDPTPRKTGFFTDYSPFYVLTAGQWGITTGDNFKKWTFASQVTQYNPYGQEVENKDALNRYSSALYGYNNRFPVAVASNTKYTELASDGFEDYVLSNCSAASHFDFQGQLKLNEVSVSATQSHTGRKSLKIEPNKKAVVKKQVVNCPLPAAKVK